MSQAHSLAQEPWLQSASLQRLLTALADAGKEARVAGGAVRNGIKAARERGAPYAAVILDHILLDRAQTGGQRGPIG